MQEVVDPKTILELHRRIWESPATLTTVLWLLPDVRTCSSWSDSVVRFTLGVPVTVRTPPRTAAEVEEVITLVVGVAAVTVATVIAGP
ncbi:hypothetical protein E2C01_019425 [Portunus trituberculatus]|uniref:Uncharacterized protein n=1 Tax=Portunus trituberculatus TaxID=210409 RepID=A0A5B7DYU9_PORTR|nr:hypothetical protein [Portunus trituberculatus]